MPAYFSTRLTAIMMATLLTACGAAETVSAQTAQKDERDTLTQSDVASNALPEDVRKFGRLAHPTSLNGDVTELHLPGNEWIGFPLIGHIDEEGFIQFLDPLSIPNPEKFAGPLENFLTEMETCESGWKNHENGEALVIKYSLSASGSMLAAANSESLADWISTGQVTDPTGSYLDIYYAWEEASAKGQCKQDGAFTINYDVDLSPGLNIFRVEHVEVVMFDAANGDDPEYEGSIKYIEKRITSETDFPDDMQWYLSYSAH